MADQTTAGERRPSPKALLKLAERETRGKLKVFLGMAPGVGKTYAMLSQARALARDKVDVVVGVVETHGRSETAAMLDGLEVMARRPVAYRKQTLMEFDVEAAIARRPKLMLVDEFAHSNAPGSLHPKRYQDVEDLLQSGIDVWTTLNIQHMESLTDVVEKITGVTVRETVPDKVLEKADEIVVVDLPPDELIKRLKEGKVYLPENARRAVDQFFRPGNLTALRELALRRTADRVDGQMLSQLRQQGIEGAWPTAERILVCVGDDAFSEQVVRAAARMAAALKSEWVALHLKSSEREDTNRSRQRRADKALRLAERLGATTARVIAKDRVAEILGYAKRTNVTQIVIGRSGSAIIEWLGRSLSHELLRRASDISVTIVTPKAPEKREPLFSNPRPHVALTGATAAVIAVLAGIAGGLALEQITALPNLSMVFLFAVLLCALTYGMWSAIAAAVLSFFAYNFFFIDPRHTFTVAEPYELFSLLIFLVVAAVTGGLAGRLKEQATATRERAEATQALYDFARKLSGAPRIDDVFWLLASQSAAIAKGKSVILLGSGNDLQIRGGWPPEDELSTPDWAAARWANERGEAAGKLTATLPSAHYQFRPLNASQGRIGVIGIAPGGDDDDALPEATDSALQSFIDQATIAIERTRLVEEAATAATAVETERLRAALLSSISHDLRTPLASIVGAVTSLRQLGSRMSSEDRGDLLAGIEEESARLSRLVSNLLDMTRIEAGALDIRRDWVDVGDVVRTAAVRARKSFPKRAIGLNVEDGLPLVRGDATLLEQVMFNVLDNANKYSGPQSATEVAVRRAEQALEIAVVDEGHGIPEDSLEKVFDKFYRVAGRDGRAPGTGLGLAICAGIVAALGGTIRAESPVARGRGTRIRVTLPVAPERAGDAPSVEATTP